MGLVLKDHSRLSRIFSSTGRHLYSKRISRRKRKALRAQDVLFRADLKALGILK